MAARRPRYAEVEREWEPREESPRSRIPRRRFTYRAYVPAPIADAPIELEDWAVQQVTRAERALATLDAHAESISLQTVARQLLRADGVASSRIEGLIVG